MVDAMDFDDGFMRVKSEGQQRRDSPDYWKIFLNKFFLPLIALLGAVLVVLQIIVICTSVTAI